MWMPWEALFEVYSLDEFVEKVVGKPLSELLDRTTKESLPRYRDALIKVSQTTSFLPLKSVVTVWSSNSPDHLVHSFQSYVVLRTGA